MLTLWKLFAKAGKLFLLYHQEDEINLFTIVIHMWIAIFYFCLCEKQDIKYQMY